MGNVEGTQRFNIKPENIIKDTKHGKVIKNSSNEEAEVFRIQIPSEKVQNYLAIYNKRQYKPGCMVRVIGYYPEDSFVCGQHNYYTIVTQRLIRMQQIQELEYDSVLSVVKQVLILYQNLSETFGSFNIKPSMIGRSLEGYIKLWINQNLGQNQVDQQNKNFKLNDIDYARNICEIVSKRAEKNSREKIRNLFFQQKFNKYKLEQIINFISNLQIAKRLNSKFSLNSNNTVSNLDNKSDGSIFTFSKQKPISYINSSLKYPQIGRYKFNPTHSLSPTRNTFDFQPNPTSSVVVPYKYNAPINQFPLYSQTSQPSYQNYSRNYQPFYLTIPQTLSKIQLPKQQLYQSQKLYTDTTNQNLFPSKQQLHSTGPMTLTNISTIPNISPFHQEVKQLKTASAHNNAIYSMNSSIKNKLQQTQVPTTVSPSQIVKPTITSLQNSVDKQVPDLVMISSHIFVTNQDLYSNVDNMARQQNLRIQQSQILRRLSYRRSKASDEQL